MLEPPPVVGHPSGKRLFVACSGVVVAIYILTWRSAVLTSQIARDRESHPVKEVPWAVVVFDFNAVVGMETIAAKLTIPRTQCILTHAVVVRNYRNPRLRTPHDPQSRPNPGYPRRQPAA